LGDSPIKYEWVVLPVANEPGKALILLISLALIFGIVWMWAESLFWGIFAAVVVVLGVREFYIPVSYSLTDEGATSRLLFFRRRMDWNNVKRIFPERHGVFLSPFARRSRLENFRGFFLRWGKDSPKEEVLEFIKKRIETTPQAGTNNVTNGEK